MSEQLWSDERIAEWVDDHWDGAGAAEAIAREMRDDLQARIAELEANADHDALTAAYLRGVSDERERGRKRIAELEAKVAYYESPLPVGNGKRYEVTCDHRFTDEGVCVRCGEDAEEWDAGCVESIVNDVLDRDKRITDLEAQLAAASQWQPVEGTLDFFDNEHGLVALLSAQEIKVEIQADKIYTINFSDDEPLLRLCESRTPAAGE